MKQRICQHCKKSKDAVNFRMDKRYDDGLSPNCLDCMKNKVVKNEVIFTTAPKPETSKICPDCKMIKNIKIWYIDDSGLCYDCSPIQAELKKEEVINFIMKTEGISRKNAISSINENSLKQMKRDKYVTKVKKKVEFVKRLEKMENFLGE